MPACQLLLFALLNLTSDRYVADEADDQHCQDQGNLCVAQPETTQKWFSHPVGKRRAEWPGYDVGKPEGKYLVQTKQPVSQRWEREQDCKEYQRGKVT